MRISVALTPKLLQEPRQHAVAVVDVLRATTSLVTMLENGLLRAIISDNIQHARKLALNNFSLLCGEVNARQPAGFDYGNSPSEFACTTLLFRLVDCLYSGLLNAPLPLPSAPWQISQRFL